MLEREVEQLKEALFQELQMYEEVLNLEKSKTEVIKRGKVKELEEMTKKEQQYMMKMGTFERIRRSVFINAADTLEVDEIDSLSEFLLHLTDQQVIDELDEIRYKLLETIEAIHETNQINQKLMEQHLEYIEMSLELMTDHLTDDNNYGKKADGKGKVKTNLFDARV
ncbi:flagellar protein FlgN [Alkaliphilus crotonatoxidans]